jgi:hypothetical protein
VAEAERELAKIFLTIAHHPTKTDIKRLKAVAE